jgi:hypothetical protein
MNDALRGDIHDPGTPMGVGSVGRRVARILLVTVLIGFFIVRYAIRQYYRRELTWHAGER